jgi:hypothetical protein
VGGVTLAGRSFLSFLPPWVLDEFLAFWTKSIMMTNINGRRLRIDILDHIEAADIVFEVAAPPRRMLPTFGERVRAAQQASISHRWILR